MKQRRIHISGAQIRAQLKADLIGKDSFRGVTLTYAWLANQFGHFALGFIPAMLLSVLLNYFMPANQAEKTAPVVVGLLWLFFELYNFLGPLLSKYKSRSARVFVPGARYQFQPPWWNIAFDTATDVVFFNLGAYSAGYFMTGLPGMLIVALVCLVLLLYPSRYWYSTKLIIQEAGYPFQFRLSQWDNSISATDRQTVLDFLTDAGSTSTHLLIFGATNSGKTSLAVGLATELSFRQQTCTYGTANQWFEWMYPQQSPPATGALPAWNWRSADLLIVDDLNSGRPDLSPVITPGEFQMALKNVLGDDQVNRKILCETSIIWVIGGTAASQEKSWRSFLKDLGVSNAAVHSVELSG